MAVQKVFIERDGYREMKIEVMDDDGVIFICIEESDKEISFDLCLEDNEEFLSEVQHAIKESEKIQEG